MKGVVFTGNSRIELMTFEDPTPGPGEVVVEIKASGMCGSDLKLYRAPPGAATAGLGLKEDVGLIIAGHEPCGVVVAVGPGVKPKEAFSGMRAMVHHYRGCGGCPQCSTGWMQLCDTGVEEIYGVTSHGGHARYMKCPARTVMPLPEELTFTTGAAIACGTGTAWGALKRLNLQGDETIAIFGQGPVGLSATQLASHLGARVIALDTNPDRLGRAKAFGADETLDPSATEDVVGAIRSLTGGLGAHLALDASSAPSARRAAVQCVRTWGRVCFVGEGGQVSLDVSSDMIRRQVTLIGSWTFSTAGQAACARFVADRGIAVDDLFTDRWRMDDAVAAYEHFDKQASGKGVFVAD